MNPSPYRRGSFSFSALRDGLEIARARELARLDDSAVISIKGE